MSRRRLISALTALSIAGGAAFTAPAFGATMGTIEEQRMADRYQPQYINTTQRADTDRYFVIELDPTNKLPRDTDFSLRGTFLNTGMRVADGLLISVDPSGELLVSSDDVYYHEEWDSEGRSTSVSVVVHYPDSSTEIITADIRFIPLSKNLHRPNYPSASEIVPGDSIEVELSDPSEVPTGSKFDLVGHPDIDQRLIEGWAFDMDSDTGVLTVSAPEDGSGYFAVPLTVTYPDKSQDLLSVDIDVVDFYSPEQPEEPHIPPTPTRGGSSLSSF